MSDESIPPSVLGLVTHLRGLQLRYKLDNLIASRDDLTLHWSGDVLEVHRDGGVDLVVDTAV